MSASGPAAPIPTFVDVDHYPVSVERGLSHRADVLDVVNPAWPDAPAS